MARQVLYVDPEQGRDDQAGRSQDQPLKTIAAALRLHQTETTIQLKAGLYTSTSGEEFPIAVPAGCELVGETRGDRPATILQGGGSIQSSILGQQTATCRLQDGAKLKNITIINTQAQGVGLWLAEGRAQAELVTVMKCPQYGAVALEQALPLLKNCIFEDCGVAGVALFSQSKGVFERVFCRKNRTGMLMRDSASPLIMASSFQQNVIGVAIADTANPVLRGNRITNNQTHGIQLSERATADFGQAQDVGNNIVRNNGQTDIQNRARRSLISCGNDVLPQRVSGNVDLVASDIPDASVVPSPLLDRPATVSPTPPTPTPTPPSESKGVTPPQGSTRFTDMANHWAGPFVDGLVEAGAVAGVGDGSFRPNQQVTRAEFAAFVVASFPDRPLKNPPAQFRDVTSEFWGYEVLSKAQQMGFLTGFPDGTMRPNDPITRIQAIVAIANGLELSGGRADDIGIYRDRAQVPSYAIDALAAATQRRLVVNYPEPLILRPLEPITRGEVAALIYQGRLAVGTSAAIASPYIVQPDTTQPLFSDLDNHWATGFIRELAEANLISGLSDGRFAPEAPINRAQFAALIANAFQPSPQQPSRNFRDVPAHHWAIRAIQTAYQGEFMSGFPDGTFAPDHRLLRVQIWVALVNGLQLTYPDVDLQPLGQFADYASLPRYALTQTAIALEQQLITTHPNPSRLRPSQIATRADACVSVYQALVGLDRFPAIASQYIA
ncbi:S-layer homology domain-containing protein [Oscillatoria sp. CS-180]|uniref:S-layer homology domain-containing protein n=1 Tax=Oscillatoria sp. CS-180 TaxID=3021720 RepID=UPI00232F0C5F|nr:S-layer homology domain-containing protein [Oscillatoria sp. CS-180]MDB9528376.1 S-layer homology domain-containing protein [Oscillatoria sp. CS-180]